MIEKKENMLRELAAIESRIRGREREHAWEMAKLRKKREEIQKMISEALTTGRDMAIIHKDAMDKENAGKRVEHVVYEEACETANERVEERR